METIKLVADPYPPYQYKMVDKIVGVDYDLIQTAFEIQNIKIEVDLHTWKECVAILESGAVDGLFQIQPTPERENQFYFSKPLRTAKTKWLQNVNCDIDINPSMTIDQILKSYTIGVVKGYAYDKGIDTLEHSNKVTVSSQEALLQGLVDREFDLALMDQGVAKYLSTKLGITEVKPGFGFEIERPLHVAFNKNRPDLAKILNTGLDEIDHRGLRRPIYAHYKLTE